MGAIHWLATGRSAQALWLCALFGCSVEAPIIETGTLPVGQVGRAYEADLQASAPEDAELTWSLVGGVLPPGLALSRSGLIRGTPEQAGEYRFEIAVKNGRGAGAQRQFQAEIGQGEPLTMVTTQFPEATVNESYSVELEAVGGVAPYRWKITAGAFPDGLAFSSVDLLMFVSGTPAAEGAYRFALELQDDRGASVTRQVSLQVHSERSVLRVKSVQLPPGRVGVLFQGRLESAGSALGTRDWSVVEGQLPPGLALVPQGASAAIEGIPQQAGIFALAVEVRADRSTGAVARNLEIRISPASEVAVSPVSRTSSVGGTTVAEREACDGCPATGEAVVGASLGSLSSKAGGGSSTEPASPSAVGQPSEETNGTDSPGSGAIKAGVDPLEGLPSSGAAEAEAQDGAPEDGRSSDTTGASDDGAEGPSSPGAAEAPEPGSEGSPLPETVDASDSGSEGTSTDGTDEDRPQSP